MFFKQKMFYYKLNLFIQFSGMVQKLQKHSLNPQWLRNVKSKNILWRLDIYLSKTKYSEKP